MSSSHLNTSYISPQTQSEIKAKQNERNRTSTYRLPPIGIQITLTLPIPTMQTSSVSSHSIEGLLGRLRRDIGLARGLANSPFRMADTALGLRLWRWAVHQWRHVVGGTRHSIAGSTRTAKRRQHLMLARHGERVIFRWDASQSGCVGWTGSDGERYETAVEWDVMYASAQYETIQ